MRYPLDAQQQNAKKTMSVLATRIGSVKRCAAKSGTNTRIFFIHCGGRKALQYSPRLAPRSSNRASGSATFATARNNRWLGLTTMAFLAELHTARSRDSLPT